MTKTKYTQNNIDRLNKTNKFLISGSIFCMFSYIILLGLTSLNVVSVKSVTKSIEDSKSELSTVELSYMSQENMMVLENEENIDFSQAINIAYVSDAKEKDTNTVAIAISAK